MKQGKILIVEDEPVVALDLRQALEQAGFNVVGVAESADEALVAAEGQNPDLALMDVSIEGTMDGIQTAKVLRQWFNIPVVFVTAFSDQETVLRAASQLAFGYLTKPIRARELLATVQVALHKAMAEAKEREVRSEMIAALDATRDGLILTSLEGDIRYMNAAMELLTGRTLSEALGKSLGEVLNLRDETNHEVRSLAGFGDGAAELFGWRMKNANEGEVRVDLSVSVAEDAEGRPRGMVLSLRDAAGRMRQHAMEDLQVERSAFDGSSMAMALLDPSGRIARVNKAMTDASGERAEDLIGRPLKRLATKLDARVPKDLLHKMVNDPRNAKSSQAEQARTTN
jgi:PAS domain S-box-containing protein